MSVTPPPHRAAIDGVRGREVAGKTLPAYIGVFAVGMRNTSLTAVFRSMCILLGLAMVILRAAWNESSLGDQLMRAALLASLWPRLLVVGAATIAIATVSWRVVERPALARMRARRRRAAGWAKPAVEVS